MDGFGISGTGAGGAVGGDPLSPKGANGPPPKGAAKSGAASSSPSKNAALATSAEAATSSAGLGASPATASAASSSTAVADTAAPGGGLEEAQTCKIHSAIRWGKTEAEVTKVIEDVGTTFTEALAAKDPKNGNHAIHISAQNGHIHLVKLLISNKADLNVKNGKGNTALHMSVEYDFYFQSEVLINAGADRTATNAEGHQAVTGIEGSKIGTDAWDNPVNILKAAGDDPQQLGFALSAIEKASPDTIDKAQLAQAGMAKKRAFKANWDAARFMDIMKKL